MCLYVIVDLIDDFIQQHNNYLFEALSKTTVICLRQISYVLVVAIVINYTKLRHWGVEVWSKLRPNFDTPSVEVWSKFGRSLVSQFGRHFINFTMCFIDISSKRRPNFDTGGVEVWSKCGRSVVEVSTLGVSTFGRNFDQTSTPTSFKIS